MLTESELAWLTQRDDIEVACDSYRVPGLDDGYDLDPDWQDAAEFEARVASKLANPQWAVCWNSDSCLEFDGSKDEPRWWWNCEWCRLKHARLQVEEEINA